jgi:hypothetical protein
MTIPAASAASQACAWNACLAVVVDAVKSRGDGSCQLPVLTRALSVCVDAVVALGRSSGTSTEGDRGKWRSSSIWQMEACIHLISSVPAVISAATAAGDVHNDQLISACRVVEEWMCDDAACVALVWLMALPSAGAFAFLVQLECSVHVSLCS